VAAPGAEAFGPNQTDSFQRNFGRGEGQGPAPVTTRLPALAMVGPAFYTGTPMRLRYQDPEAPSAPGPCLARAGPRRPYSEHQGAT